MGLPSITIAFQTTGITAIQRSEKGTVALILRDSAGQGSYELSDITEIPSGLSADNTACIQRAFLGYQYPPKKVLVHVMGTDGAIADGLSWAETQEFDYLCGPLDLNSSDAASIASWACVRICARITSFVFGSMPPVSTRENLRLRHSLSP